MRRKHFLLVLYMLLISVTAMAQRAVVGLPKMNMLYIGIENPVEVAVEGIKAKDLIVEMNGGKLTGENGKYIFVPDGSKHSVILKIGKKKRNKIVWVDSVEYRISKLPFYEINLDSFTGDNITSDEISKIDSIKVFFNERHPLNGIKPVVTDFILAIDRDTGNAYFEVISGSVFSKSAKKQLSSLKPGYKIIIANINCKLNGKTFILNGRTFNVIEKIESQIREKQILPEEKVFYPNNKIKIQFTNNLVDSTGSFIYFYENEIAFIQGNYLLKSDFVLVVDTSLYLKDDTISIYQEIDKCFFGSCKMFYQNGKIREEGNFDTVKLKPNSFIMADVQFDPYDPDSRFRLQLFSVRHGLWKFYDEKGNLFRQTVYDKGRVKE